MWLLIHAGLKLIHVSKIGSWSWYALTNHTIVSSILSVGIYYDLTFTWYIITPSPECNYISNRQKNQLFSVSKQNKIQKLRITGHLCGEPPMTDGFESVEYWLSMIWQNRYWLKYRRHPVQPHPCPLQRKMTRLQTWQRLNAHMPRCKGNVRNVFIQELCVVLNVLAVASWLICW